MNSHTTHNGALKPPPGSTLEGAAVKQLVAVETVLARHGWLLLYLLLCGAALFCRPPMPVDETRYLSVAWEMWRDGNFLVPHSNGVPYSHKPPLLFWLINAGWLVFGVQEWSARLTAPLFGLGVILLTRSLARLLWPGNPAVAVHVPWLFLGTVFWSMYATLTLFDQMLACWGVMAWIALWRASREGGAHGVKAWLVYGLSLTLGILTKGPVFFLAVLPAALLAPWWAGGRKLCLGSWYMSLFLATIAGSALSLTWVLPAAKAGGVAYADALLVHQTMNRISHSFAHQRPFGFYLGFVPVLLFPFSFWPPVWNLELKLPASPQVRFCLAVLVPGFLLFSLISGKQVHYLLPLMPVAVLLFAHTIERAPVRFHPIPWLIIGVLPLFSLGLFVAPHLQLRGGDTEMLLALPPWLGSGPLLAAILLLWTGALYPKRDFRRQPGQGHGVAGLRTISTVMVMLLIFFHWSLADTLARLYDWREMGTRMRNAQAEGKTVAVYPPRLADQPHFAGRLLASLIRLETWSEATDWAVKHPGQSMLIYLEDSDCTLFPPTDGKSALKNGCLLLLSSENFVRENNGLRATR